LDASSKATLVFDASTDKPVNNVVRAEINREFGDLIFHPASGPGRYYIYYMPYTFQFIEGSGDYRLIYDTPKDTADADWVMRHGIAGDRLAAGGWTNLPTAEVVEIQARTEFDRFDPMEVCATRTETSELVTQSPRRDYYTFPEERRYPIRMKSDLPLRWIERGPGTEFRGEACRNEFYAFQIGLYPPEKQLSSIRLGFSDLKTKSGHSIPTSAIRCFNTGGVDANGRPFTRTVVAAKGKVLPFWLGVQVPRDAIPGVYEGTATIKPGNAEKTEVRLFISVTNQVLEDCGDGEPWRHSRLRWLGSKIGIDDNVTAPYTPVTVKARTVSVLQRDLRLGNDGLPESITSQGQEILARPIRLIAETAAGIVSWKGEGPKVTRLVPAQAILETLSGGDGLELNSSVTTEYDGYVALKLRLRALADVNLKNLRLEIPYRREVTTYMMGQGGKERGGLRSSGDMENLPSQVWLGNVHAGMQVTLPAGARHYREAGGEVTLCDNLGAMRLKHGQEQEICFQLLITPLKPLNPDHWNWRYFQAWKDAGSPERAARDHVKILSVHHANEYNPYINYPFLTTEKLGAFAKDAHERGMKVKYYYTLRELSNYAVELWAFRAVEPNMFPTQNKRGGSAWLQEHVFEDYDRAWHSWSANTSVTDAAILTTGHSRLMNYYLEGLHWLTKYLGDDGLYIDGLAYDREGMRRVRKALDSAKAGCIIDFHCGREQSSNANLFLKHFPYVDSIWFGEGFNYDEKPDYWLIEVAGLPFGLWGEMLGAGNPWRGMLYGMSSRLGWGGDPRAVWKTWDDFGIQDAKMIGYWEKGCPVSTGRDDILATVYVKKDKALISLASWAQESVQVHLAVDWNRLGIDAGNLRAPKIEGFQQERVFRPNEAIPTPKGKGWLLLVGN